jgi:hypothetical protein
MRISGNAVFGLCVGRQGTISDNKFYIPITESYFLPTTTIMTRKKNLESTERENESGKP